MGDLVLENISHCYGNNKIINNISIKAAQGEITCLLGPSGCGKTTIFKIAAALEEIQEGKVILDGVDISDVPAQKRSVGLVFQNPSLFPHLSIIKNVMFGMGKIDNKEQKAKNILKKVGMDKYCNSYPDELSGGQQQRVAIARAVANSPKVLLLDEPFSNLDSVLRKRIRQELVSILRVLNIPSLIVTHEPEEALVMSDIIYVMQDGAIIQSGAARDLYNKPVSKFIASFFGDINVFRAKLNGKKIVSDIGDFNYKGSLKSGNVDVVIRPEDIVINTKKSKNTIEAEVMDIRFVGIGSIVHFKILSSNIKLQARCSNLLDLQIGDKKDIKIEKINVFNRSK